MPQTDRITVQTFPFAITSATDVYQPIPNNPRREYLLIQNQSANPLQVQFGKKAVGNTNLIIAANSYIEWKEKVPVDSVNLTSAMATNGVIIEGMTAPVVNER